MRDEAHEQRKGEYEEPLIQGLLLKDLRYANYTELLATTPRGLENLIKSAKNYSNEIGLHLNLEETEIMDIDKCKEDAVMLIDGEEIQRVNSY